MKSFPVRKKKFFFIRFSRRMKIYGNRNRKRKERKERKRKNEKKDKGPIRMYDRVW